jgi:hypothetical protein
VVSLGMVSVGVIDQRILEYSRFSSVRYAATDELA